MPCLGHNLPDALAADLQAVLADLAQGAAAALGPALVGVYAVGSLALGDFDARSDVDFAVVVADELAGPQVQAVQAMHARLYNAGASSVWARHLEGSYFPRAVLQQPLELGRRLWYLDNGARELELSDHCNSLVERWTLRERGIALAGPPPAEVVPEPVEPDSLREEIRNVIRDWGRQILADPARFANSFYQPFIALSFGRMLQSLETGTVESKRAGVGWAQARLPAPWPALIERAWHTRATGAHSVNVPADPAELPPTLAFVRYAIAQAE